MNEQERNEFIAYMEGFKREVVGNKKLAREFLVQTGIYTKKGKLAKPYRNLYIPPIEA